MEVEHQEQGESQLEMEEGGQLEVDQPVLVWAYEMGLHLVDQGSLS